MSFRIPTAHAGVLVVTGSPAFLTHSNGGANEIQVLHPANGAGEVALIVGRPEESHRLFRQIDPHKSGGLAHNAFDSAFECHGSRLVLAVRRNMTPLVAIAVAPPKMHSCCSGGAVSDNESSKEGLAGVGTQARAPVVGEDHQT